MWRNAWLLLGMAAAAACGGEARSSAARDSAGWLACREWRQVIAEADILTPAEFRSRLQPVEEQARDATTDGLAEAVRRTLQAFTTGDVAAAKDDMVFVARVCASPAMRR